MRIWAADGTGEPLILRPSNAPVNWVSWSPDGRRVVAALSDNTIVVWSDVEPLVGAEDPKLWTATTSCMPVDVRRRLLGFTGEQARADLDRCRRRVREVQAR